MSDMKVRVAAADVFYYPDVFVTCNSDDRETYFKEQPCLIVEVLSESAAGTGRREKFLAYELLKSLKEYVLVQQKSREVELFRLLRRTVLGPSPSIRVPKKSCWSH